MAKKQKQEAEVEATSVITSEAAQAAVELLTQFIAQSSSASVPAEAEAEAEEEAETETEVESETEATPAVEIPSAADLTSVKTTPGAAIAELAVALGLQTEGKKAGDVRKLVITIATIKEEGDIDEDDLNSLAEALGLTPEKKIEKTLEAVQTWIAALGTSGEETTEETEETEEVEETEETTEETEETEKTEETEEATEETAEETVEEEAATTESSDGVDRAAIAKAFAKFPKDEKVMLSRIAEYNKASETAITLVKGKVKESYRKLVAELVASDETVAEWGVAYIRDEAGYCCGLPLSDAKIKGVKNPSGKCVATGKLFVFNDEQTGFDEHPAK
jgi:hypothetical protein